MHVTVGIFGTREDCNTLASSLGKKGTTNDIAIYNHASSEGVITYVCPNSENGKIQPVLEAMNMSDIVVIVVNTLDKETGEMIIAASEMEFDKGFFMAGPGLEESVKSLVKNSPLESFVFVEDDKELRAKIIEAANNIQRADTPLVFPIDNSFKVKGVGTIVLGVVKSGIVKKHDVLRIEPLGKDVIVKGIQSQDKHIEEAFSGMRLGLNLKGIEPDEIKRGFVISTPNSVKTSSEIKLSFKKNSFFKQEIKEGINVLLSVGLQTISCSVKSVSNNELIISTSRPIAYTNKQRCIIASQTDIMPRIVGSGNIE